MWRDDKNYIPGLILFLPHKWTSCIADSVRNEDNRVRGRAWVRNVSCQSQETRRRNSTEERTLRVSGSNRTDPSKKNDEGREHENYTIRLACRIGRKRREADDRLTRNPVREQQANFVMGRQLLH